MHPGSRLPLRGKRGQHVLAFLLGATLGCGPAAPSSEPTEVAPVAETSAALTLEANLVSNPSFEADTAGWTVWEATVSRVALSGAPHGAYVARAARAGTAGSYVLNHWPPAVSQSVAGASYGGWASVRAASTSAVGRPIVLKIREMTPAGAVVREWSSPAATLTNSFQRLEATAQAVGSGNTLDVRVSQSSAATGDAFYVDDVALGLVAASGGTLRTYVASSEDFANPERGFYMPEYAWANARANNLSLVRRVFQMDAYRYTTLPQTYLDSVAADFARARRDGVKLIPRFVYDFTGAGTDASRDRVLGHLDQLAPILNANADVLAFMEAGFVGKWGEWHGSSNGLVSGDSLTDASRLIIDKILQVLPANRMMALRYSRHMQQKFGATPLQQAEAHTGTARARVGNHNDCFLASSNDWWSYGPDVEKDKSYLAAATTWAVQGGETCNYAADAQPYVTCTNARSELARFHFSTLNYVFKDDVITRWQTDGCLAEFKRNLGYRLRLVDATLPTQASPGGAFSLTLHVRNDGYAAPYNPRPLDVVLRHRTSGATHRIRASADPRFWLPGVQHEVKVTATLPSGLALGAYDVLLHLPDAATSLRDRPEYAIRLANQGLWEATTGFNSLQHILDVR
jgi:hypothetical protein